MYSDAAGWARGQQVEPACKKTRYSMLHIKMTDKIAKNVTWLPRQIKSVQTSAQVKINKYKY